MTSDPFDLGDPTDFETVNAPPQAGLAQQANAARGQAQLPDILHNLNQEQRDAVTADNGSLLLLAGAGTGKTRALTSRIAYKIATGQAQAGEVLAVTFTNKAAREMRDRITALVGENIEGRAWIGTFHALATRILRRHAELVGLKSDFTILDTDDQIRLLKQIIQAENIDEKRWPARQMACFIDQWKNRGWTPAQVPENQAAYFANGLGRKIYEAYQSRLKILNAADFGDLLLECLCLFQQNADVLSIYQNRFLHIFVDEYQDTNNVQYLWLRLLAQAHGNICCVGDDDQSIYGWRGAEVKNILRFETDFPDAQIIRLERNYRSTPHILGAASGLIAANKSRLGKTLWTDREQEGDKVALRSLWDSEEEARVIADDIEHLQLKKYNLNEIAVLVRASFQMREFEDRFIALGIPYRVIGGPRFYERAEIRDANAYLRLVAQPQDDLAFERIVNKPRRGLGNVALQTLHHAARGQHISLFSAAQKIIHTEALKPAARRSLTAFLLQLEQWQKKKDEVPHPQLAELILDESGYTAMWQQDKSPDAPGKLENLKELIRSMEDFPSLAEYLEHISLVMDNADTDSDDKVSIMTLHASKGLEFDHVFLPGWEEGLFPHQRSLDEGNNGEEEERRLAYVGLTRAKLRASISFVGNRKTHGQWTAALPSRFIDELPPEHVEVEAAQQAMPHVAPSELTGKRASSFAQKSFTQKEGAIKDAEFEMSSSAFKKGERIFHVKFGYGRVTAIEGEKLSINFEKAGAKKVIDRFVEKA